jgi:predicted RNase H-like HicB family nuclease
MAKYVYPAVFTPDTGGYCVCFPNVDGCFTEGNNLADAMEMANDALCLMMYDYEQGGKPIPEPSNMKDIPCGENEFVTLINCDTEFYVRWFKRKERRQLSKTRPPYKAFSRRR